jgi:hypothetical protein
MNKRFNEPDDFRGRKPSSVNPKADAPEYNQMGRMDMNKAKKEFGSQMKSKKQE